MQLQADAQTVAVTLQDIQKDPSNPGDRLQEAFNLLTQSLYAQSLDSWLMKSLVSITGMKEGTFNEREVLESILIH